MVVSKAHPLALLGDHVTGGSWVKEGSPRPELRPSFPPHLADAMYHTPRPIGGGTHRDGGSSRVRERILGLILCRLDRSRSFCQDHSPGKTLGLSASLCPDPMSGLGPHGIRPHF